jgi:CRP-like cAMP-binding protein
VNAATGIPALPTLSLFQGLNETECHQLTEILEVRGFSAGQLVFEQGQISQALWVLLEGTCEVITYYDHKPKESVVLAELQTNSYFGEMSFFSPAPHSASVRAKSDVKLLRLSRSEYDDLIRDGVSAAYKVAYNVLRGMAGRLRHMDEWVARLVADQEPNAAPGTKPAQQAEWLVFRDKLFNGWNL